jgi:hypothetical protein
VAVPPAFARETGLHRTAEALQEEVKAAPRESGMGLTVGLCSEPQARQMGQMTAGGVAVQDLQQQYCTVVTGVSARSRHAVYPSSPHTARMASGGSSVAHSPVNRCRMVVNSGPWGHLLDNRGFDAHPYRRCVENPNMYETHGRDHDCCLT